MAAWGAFIITVKIGHGLLVCTRAVYGSTISTRSMGRKFDGRNVVTLWDGHKALLADVPAAASVGDRAEAWRRRLNARGRLAALLIRPATRDQELNDACNELSAAGGVRGKILLTPTA